MTFELESKTGSTPIVNKPLVNKSTYIGCDYVQECLHHIKMLTDHEEDVVTVQMVTIYSIYIQH